MGFKFVEDAFFNNFPDGALWCSFYDVGRDKALVQSLYNSLFASDFTFTCFDVTENGEVFIDQEGRIQKIGEIRSDILENQEKANQFDESIGVYHERGENSLKKEAESDEIPSLIDQNSEQDSVIKKNNLNDCFSLSDQTVVSPEKEIKEHLYLRVKNLNKQALENKKTRAVVFLVVSYNLGEITNLLGFRSNFFSKNNIFSMILGDTTLLNHSADKEIIFNISDRSCSISKNSKLASITPSKRPFFSTQTAFFSSQFEQLLPNQNDDDFVRVFSLICNNDRSELRKMLVEKHNVKSLKDCFGSNLLLLAVKEGSDIDIVQELLLHEEDIDIYEPNFFGETAAALARENVDYAPFFLRRMKGDVGNGFGLEKRQISSSLNQLHMINYAIFCGIFYENFDLIDSVLKRKSITNIDNLDSILNFPHGHKKETILMAACRKAGIDLVNLLLDSGADFRVKNIDRKDAIIFASENSRLDIVQLLRSRGAGFRRVDSMGLTFS